MSRKLPSPMKWQQFAIVNATTVFGILDNLRYDRACPATEQDANMLEQFLTNPGEYTRIKFVITRWSEDKKSLWTMDRWRSRQLTLEPSDESETYHIERELVRRENEAAN